MARQARFAQISEGNIYHITARGSGRRVIFEDDSDRKSYLQKLFSLVDDSEGSLIAWCLMSNHVHLLFQMELHALSKLMQQLHTAYAQRFNGRHGHLGSVFQGRFNSVAVSTDEQLVVTTKYIHRNPKDIPDVDWKLYQWSSYHGYLDGTAHCDSALVLDLLGGIGGFVEFHETDEDIEMLRFDGYRRRLSDAEAIKMLEKRIGKQYADLLTSLPKNERDEKLVQLCRLGLSVRQIERLTGIGRGIVNRAVAQWQ